MTKIVVVSPSLTQPLLLYLSLKQAMLDSIGGVSGCAESKKKSTTKVSEKDACFI
jgi:hypothetical protein